MRKLIGGIMYDTEKADLVCVMGPYHQRSIDGGSFRKKASLYRGHGGHFFQLAEYPGEEKWYWRLLTADVPGTPPNIFPCSDEEAARFAMDCGVVLPKEWTKEWEEA